MGGAQWYVGCAQLYVESTGGSSAPDKTVSIPGYVSATEPGVLYDYWANMKPASYAIPGPAPYVSSGSGGGDPIPGDFVKYEKYGGECLVKNANWCAVSVPAFKDQGSCYSSAALCWSQLDKCYAVAPPTGNKGCREWEARCTRQRVRHPHPPHV